MPHLGIFYGFVKKKNHQAFHTPLTWGIHVHKYLTKHFSTFVKMQHIRIQIHFKIFCFMNTFMSITSHLLNFFS